MAVLEVNVRGSVNSKLMLIADSQKEAIEKAKLMLTNDLDLNISDIEYEVLLVEGELQDDGGLPGFLAK